MQTYSDLDLMKIALLEAKKAFKKDEVPVGAIIVRNGKIIAKAHNLREKRNEITAHAELLAIKKASKKLKSWHLDGCEIYVTLEPCPMCASAILNSRISKIVFGADDERVGAFGSHSNLVEISGYNFKPEIKKGILKEDCSSILSNFFKTKREKK